MARSQHLSLQGLFVLLLGTMVGGQVLELRLKDGAHRCEGRVEAKYKGEWGTVYAKYWFTISAEVVCRQLECGVAIGAPRGSYFGPRLGPIWFLYESCESIDIESSLKLYMCIYMDFKNYNDTYSHDQDIGAVCSGSVRLIGGDRPCSGRVEVHTGKAWIPVSDGNFTLPTAQVICAELGCGKAVSVLKHMPFRESDGQVWAEEFRCEGEEPELRVCPRVPCPGGTCHHSGAAQVVCSAYSEVRLMTNGSSQCEGQVEMNISGRWRALCASHWSLANANVVCHQLGCGVAISTPKGPHLVGRDDQISTAQFHCLGAESFLWSCPVTALGGSDCSHGNMASVICSGNQTQVPQCSDSLSEPTGSAASEESAYCSDSRQLRLVDGGGPCAGRVEILDQGSWGTICDDGWDLDDARVVCKQLGCGEALNATGSAHFGAGSGPIWLDDLNCTGNESHVWRCPSRGWGRHDCRHKQDAGVVCSDSRQLRLVDGGGPCAGRVEILDQGSWGTICDNGWDLDDARVVCRQLGCGEALNATGSAHFGEGPGPIWLETLDCTGKESHVWKCPSQGWRVHNCSHEKDAGVVCSDSRQLRLVDGGGPIWLDDLNCTGKESHVWRCSSQGWGRHDCRHKEDAGVICSDSRQLRLVDGGGPCAGRVEILDQGSWGTICDDGWDLDDARVVCKQLGCGEALNATRSAHFGAGSGPIWLDDLNCTGNESNVWSCPSRGWGRHDCRHKEDAGVICSGSKQLRLVDGGGSCAGRVEILDQGSWGTICDDGWDLDDARVVCRQLGCGGALDALKFAQLGQGSGPIWLDELNCGGKESHVWRCPSRGWGRHDCEHAEDAGVVCSDSRQLRLVDGGGPCAGRVEILDQGSWGTICDDGWDLDDARVVCRQLGCGEAVNATRSAHFGAGSGPIWLDDLNCTGNESHVWRCPSQGWGRHDCRHKEDAGVICSEFLALRMVSEDQQCAGWLEVFYNGTWGSVCRSPMDDVTMSVICRQLGCGDSGSLNSSVALREDSRPRWVDGIKCRRADTSLWQCPSDPWNYNSCSPKEEAYVSCAERRPKSCPAAAPCTDREKLRLRGGDSECSGRVEVWHSGSWGTVCDDSWSLAEAEVVCQQLGCGPALEAVRAAAFGPGSGSIWLDEVRCGGRESSLWDCAAVPWGQSDCKHEEDAGVRCSGDRQLRLVDGGGPCAGRVEILDQGSWGTICDDGWDLDDARVVCRQLGCGEALNATGSAHFGAGSGPIWLNNLNCTGNESHVWKCPSRGWGQHDCRHKQDAGVICSGGKQLRLVDGDSSCTGRVEILDQGSWGTICDDGWDLDDARVVCRQLGCGGALDALKFAQLGQGSGPIWLDDLNCRGKESHVWRCPSRGWGRHDCEHAEDAGVVCSGRRQLRLVDGGGPCAGRVEILDQGSWGTICDDGWDLDDARVVCRQLGCGEAVNATGSAHFGAGSGPIWLDDLNCAGNESHVWRCPSQGWGRHDCRHKEDAGVICSEFLALRMVSEDQQCAGWLEVFYNGTWGSVCRSPMEDITVSMICRQLGCGDSGSLNSSVALREGSRPRWVDGIKCRKTDTSLWQCPSDPWNYNSCSPKEEAYILCAGGRHQSCPAAAPCTDREKLRLRGGDSECSGRVEVWHNGSWGTVCDDSWSLAEAEVVCQQLGCGPALEAVRAAAFGPGSGSIWLDEVQCGGRESSLWDCAAVPWGQSDCKHEEDAGVRCSALEVRLKDGAHSCEGRVEVKHQGEWGTVDYLNWSMEEAAVVCRQMGCGGATDAPKGAHFGLGIGPIWFRYIYYKGPESAITECSYPSVKDHRPEGNSHDKDAGAVCSALELRLINGDHSCEGRVEVKHQGKWGTVNDLNWSMEEAHVVCRQLRCGAAVDASKGSKFGPGIGPVWFHYIYCKGQESVITECSYPPLKDHRTKGYSHNKDAGAICSAREVRLKDGAHCCEGKVEVKHQGKWGTVNDQNWSLEAAAVVCRELECGAAINASRGAHFGPGIGPILFQYIYCNGTESSLMECSYPPLKNYLSDGLSHDRDAGAVCSALEVRLKDGAHRCEGRVEVKHQGKWGTVNDHNWSLEEAQVVCRQLGCGATIDAPRGAHFGPGIGPIWFHSTNCKGKESVLTVCSYPSLKDYRPEGLSHDQDAGTVCSALEVRLKDGAHRCEGRVEVKHQGEWGTVNDHNWSMEEAAVVCRQLGCGGAVDAPKGAKFGSGIGPIWFHYIYCKGPESAITKCSYPPVKDHRPEGHSHDKDAGAVCSALELRLKDGAHRCEGRVEVEHQGEWGTVNDLNWSLEETSVVCRQLGCGTAVDAPKGAKFGPGVGPIWFHYIYCKGPESAITKCSYPTVKDHHPEGHSYDKDAGAVCSGFVHLVEGDGPCLGQVEVHSGEDWTPLSDGNFVLPTAHVICAELGCGTAGSVLGHVLFRESDGRVWAEEFRCKGEEPKLQFCPRVPCPGGTCHHSGAAQLVCSGEMHVRTNLPAHSAQGTICDDGWDLDDARVVCRQLGCGEALNATRSAHFGAGSGPIWLADLNCAGNESHVWNCPSRGWGQHDCRHKEDAGVICSEFLALRMVSEDQQCAGWLEVFYNGTWGSVCRSPMEDITVSVICRQLGCGDSGSLNSSVALREGSRPQWVDGIQCQKTDTSPGSVLLTLGITLHALQRKKSISRVQEEDPRAAQLLPPAQTERSSGSGEETASAQGGWRSGTEAPGAPCAMTPGAWQRPGRGGVSAAGLWPGPGSRAGRGVWPWKREHLAGRGAVRGPGVPPVGLCRGALGAERLQARGGRRGEVLW
ncbi:unnamed protein product [Rangifer tarandus platyrhynchus]|uniref:Uncharacterized protein n=1 Tax=Rangifer tarandus platyrhynchus TaxID=3082113 RepID=A0AC59Z7U1_RANTA